MPFDLVWPLCAVYLLLAANGGAEILIKQVWVKQLAIICSTSLLVLLAGFRSLGVGSDDVAYASMLSDIPAMVDCDVLLCGYSYGQFNIELGFFTLLSFLHSISNQYQFMFFVIALLSVSLNVKAIRFFLPHVGAGVIVYFCHFYLNKELNAIRLGLASAILFWAATFIPIRRFGMVIFLVVCATFVHVTSLLFLGPLFVYWLRPGRYFYGVGAIAVILFASFLDVQGLFARVVEFGFIGEKIGAYLNADIYNYPLPVLSAVNLKNLIFIGMALVFWQRIERRFESFQLVFCFFYCASILRVALGDFAIVAGRGYAAISMFEYVLIPYVIFSLCGKWLGYLCTVIYAGLILYLNLTDNAGWTGDAIRFFDY